MNREKIIQSCIHNVQVLYQKEKIGVSHGMNHILRVLHHTEKAIQCVKQKINEDEKLCIKLASILHDVDDKKYFKSDKLFENARSILEKLILTEKNIDFIIDMISQVSCSKNGNNMNKFGKDEKYKYIPRWADRLDAVGEVGIVRCYLYSKEVGEDIFCENTPKINDSHKIIELSKKRFHLYPTKKYKSTDMISHIYDKLIVVALPEEDMIDNEYLFNLFQNSSKPLIDLCILYGNTQNEKTIIEYLENKEKNFHI
jgi:uncharacterized protein